MDEKSELLYAAAVGYMVSSRTNQDSWASIAKRVHQLVQQGNDLPFITTLVYEVERVIKKDFAISHMPAAWRTAKHTVFRALRCGVSFVDDKGNALGKTAVDKACRDAADHLPTSVALTMEQQHTDIYAQISAAHAKLQTIARIPVAGETKEQLLTLVTDLGILVGGLPTHA